MPRRRERSRRSYTALARAVIVAAVASTALQGCSMFAQREQAADDLVTGSITPHPVTAVGTQALAPIGAGPVAAAIAPAASSVPVPPPRAEMLARVVNDAPPLPAGVVMAETDRETVRRTLDSALIDQPQAVRAPWLNTATGVGGLIVPVSERFRQGGATCRRVRVSVIRGPRTDWLAAHACRPDDGEWALVEVAPSSAPDA